MKENKTMDEIHRGLLKKFHTLCSLLGMSADEKQTLISGYGVDSSRDIDTHDLVDLCGKLSSDLDKKSGDDSDYLRKRVMASIGGWLRMNGKFENAAIIKGIACRATGYSEFNKIPRERLRNLISLFRNKQEDKRRVEQVKSYVN